MWFVRVQSSITVLQSIALYVLIEKEHDEIETA